MWGFFNYHPAAINNRKTRFRWAKPILCPLCGHDGLKNNSPL